MNQAKHLAFCERTGISAKLLWGYIGIIIFMMGDGIEQGWLSPYVIGRGLNIESSAMLFTVYGITIAISSWLSGVISETYGVRKAMFWGLVLYIAGIVSFLTLGLPSLNYPVMLITYGLKGLGYPLFAYSFLVWITYETPKAQLGKAVGWFWFVFTAGLNVFGTYYASWAIVHLGHIQTLWTAIIFAVIGATMALVINKSEQNKPSQSSSKIKELMRGFTIMKEEPKVLIGGIVRTINTTAQFAFPIFMPIYMIKHGFTLNQWLYIWGAIFIANIIFNLIFGFIGDFIGWRKTVIWFGGTMAGISTLLFYYAPQFSADNYYIVMFCGILWGIALAGYVPLSALVPSLVKENKGAAMAVLNLGSGLSVFVGPALVGIFYSFIGAAGVIWLLAILYFISALLTTTITLPEENIKENFLQRLFSGKAFPAKQSSNDKGEQQHLLSADKF